MSRVTARTDRPANPRVEQQATSRSWVLDAIRGGLVILMVIYHAVYISVMSGLVYFELYEGFWWFFPRTIAAGFIAVSGWSLAGKRARGSGFRAFLMRTVRLAVPALAITLISAIMFRQGFVFFGILHLLAISSILAWPFLGKPVLALATGMAILAGGLMLGNQRFDWPYLAWLGFRPEGWYPVDYLPLLPWFAWCLFGTAARDLLLQHGLGRSLNGNSYPSQSVEQQPPTGLDTLWQAAVPQFLIYTGRHSLPIYLIHLPVLYGLASLFALLSHP